MKHLENIKSFEDLRNKYLCLYEQFMKLGDDIVDELNAEYDILYPEWRDKHNETACVKVTETAKESRKRFYTEYGWAGEKYDSNLGITDIAKAIRQFVKDTYPETKWSVRTHKYSGGCSLYVTLMESPYPLYKEFEDLTHEELGKIVSAADYNNRIKYPFSDEDLKKVFEEHEFLREKAYTKEIADMMKAVTDEVDKYRYDDSDGMIDYFSTNFWPTIRIGEWDKKYKQVVKPAKPVRSAAISKSKRSNVSATPITGDKPVIHNNEAQNGIEIIFSQKPSTNVLDELKSHGFRWNNKKKLWYAKQNEERWEVAHKIAS